MKIRIEDAGPESMRDTKFERILVFFETCGFKRCVTSPIISSNTKPMELAAMLREFSRAIEAACLLKTPPAPEAVDPIVWRDFVQAVNYVNIWPNAVWRKDFSAPPEPPTCPPTFEFHGWRVYKPVK